MGKNSDLALTMCVTCLALVNLFAKIRSQSTTPDVTPSMRYPYVTSLDHEGQYILKWGFDDREIWFQVQAHTLGYVGFGISESGLMVPADVVVGYVSNGRVIFTDYHTTAYSHPVLDSSQDWRIDHGYEENGWTVLGFNRSLDTCDTQGDIPITRDTLQLIFSYDAEDPSGPMALFHHDKRGSKPMSLLTMSAPPAVLPSDSQPINFLNNNYTIPSENASTFHCRVFDMSHVQDRYHVIKVEPVFTPETEAYVDHMILYRCSLPDANTLLQAGDSFECFTDAPDHVQFCREHVASFGHGGEHLYFPDDVGLPIGGADVGNVYVLATHYNNADYVPGLVDSSGIRLTLTSQLRPNEAGYLTVGNIISPNWLQFLPQGDPDFVQNAYCSQRCINWGFRAEQSRNATAMNVVGVQFHSHGLGKAMKLRQMRYTGWNLVRELPWMDVDNSFDSEQQTLRMLKQRRIVSNMDQLMLECTYDTTQRSQPTVGGWTEYDELCRAYILHYPRIAIEGCMSWSNYDELRDSQGARVTGNDVFNTLINTDWNNNTVMRQNLRHALDRSVENGQCWSSRQPVKYAIDYFRQPEIRVPFQEPPTSTCNQPPRV